MKSILFKKDDSFGIYHNVFIPDGYTLVDMSDVKEERPKKTVRKEAHVVRRETWFGSGENITCYIPIGAKNIKFTYEIEEEA